MAASWARCASIATSQVVSLPLIEVEEFEILLQDEDVFGAVIAGQGRPDLGLRRAASIITMLGELMRIAVAGDDVAEDP